MSTQQPASSDQSISTRRTRWQGLLVLLAIGLPMILAYTIFKTGWAMPEGTVNKGELLSPATSILDLGITDTNGKEVDVLAGKKHWRMLIIADNSCDDTCMQQLYLSRQVHIRLSEKAARVERLFLNTDQNYSSDLNDHMDKEHPRLKRYHLPASAWSEAFADTNVAGNLLNGHNVYYVDQEGFAMMAYEPSHEGADLLGDIKKLLKYSYED